MQTFNVGDVVELKSGGPSLTVEQLDGEFAWLAWFTKDGEYKEARIRAALLKRTAM